MRLTDTELISKKYTKFTQSFTNIVSDENQDNLNDSFGGIIHNGRIGWLAKGPYFEIFSLKTGQKIGKFRFNNNFDFERAIITSICEIEAHDFNGCLLAIGIQFGDAPGGIVSIYSVQGSKVLRCIEIPDKVTSCHYIGAEITKRTILQMMQGCLAVGTDIGKIILLDVNLLKCEEALFSTVGNEDDITIVPCHLVHSKLDFTHIREHYKLSIQQNVNFGIELEVVEHASLVLSLLPIPPSLCLAAGLEDGRMILYDLSELQPFHMAFPPENLSPLVKLAFLEPPDDPRPCIYLWAFHENTKNAIAVMHSIMYDKKLIEDDEFYLYEDFQLCNVRFTLPIFDNKSLPINCRTITKYPSHGDEEIVSLCLLSWKSENFTQLIIFDLNQWYKEEMPGFGDWRKNLSYLAAFRLNHCLPFDVYIDSNSIAMFNSIQRSEEHFYPISLSFDCFLLLPQGSSHVHWPGLQNRALELLNTAGSVAILEPSPYFNEIMRASLMPQFCDFNYNTTFTINVQREILLSVALEYNCFGLLKECAKNWADGSHLGKKPSEGLSLSTLTDWTWQRASLIKKRCNTLSVSLFDHSGYLIDQRNQKELSYLSRQLKLLADLMSIILSKCKDYIPSQVIDKLNSQYNSIRMASEYQEVLQWLLNIGLLPEGAASNNSESIDDNETNSNVKSQFVPYPYRVLKNYYMSQRMRFYKMNHGMVSARTQSCRVLYIDSFIEHECNPNALREQWLESGGNGLYPPPSLQAMLRTLLVPDVPLEKKYVLFIYLFLDLNMAVEEERHAAIVQNLIKFPAVFKLNASLIKTVQAFWNLDHGQFEVALEEIISPFSQDKKLLQWQQELLIESLICQDQPNLALRALQARSSPINSLLEIKTLMANDLISEAFHLTRSKNDLNLLKTFFNGCLYLGKYSILRDLALTEEESKIVAEIFKETKSSKAGNLHFINLLEKSKYVEALTYLDELALSSNGAQNQKNIDLETTQLILSAYNVTMTPASKTLADCYYKIRNRIENNSLGYTDFPKPLSCQLLKQNANNLIGGIYHSSAIGIDVATNYWETEPAHSENNINYLLDSNNAPFVRKPQLDAHTDSIAPIKDTVSYPEVYKAAQKRRYGDDETFILENENKEIDVLENPIKRRKVLDINESFISVKNNISTKQLINTSLLTKFKDKKINNTINFVDKTSLSSMTPKQNITDCASVLLNTPIVKSCRADIKDNINNDQYDIQSERMLTPQSILKVKNLIRSETPTLMHRSHYTLQSNLDQEIISDASGIGENHSDRGSALGDEEKSISFDLPVENKSLMTKIEVRAELSHINEYSHSNVSPSCRYSCPQKRKSIHSANSSVLSETSIDEFFSPVSSRDNSRLDSGNDFNVKEKELKKYIKVIPNDVDNTEPMDTSELTPKRLDDKEISKDSGADVCMSSEVSSASMSNIRTSFIRHDGPKSRRPLSPSKTPPETTNLVCDLSPVPNEQKTYLTRSIRSKTPDISLSLSPTRRSSHLSTQFERQKTPEKQLIQPISKQFTHKTLSRIVLETNIMKNVLSSVKHDASLETLEEKLNKQTNELHKEITLLKTDTEKFKPLTSSSKIAASKSLFCDDRDDQNKNRTSDHTTVDGEISFNDTLGSPNIISKTFAQHIASPQLILPADLSMVTDEYKEKNQNQTLMTTMDMSNISFNSTMFKAPENVLFDSSIDEENIKRDTDHINQESAIKKVVKINEPVKVTENVKITVTVDHGHSGENIEENQSNNSDHEKGSRNSNSSGSSSGSGIEICCNSVISEYNEDSENEIVKNNQSEFNNSNIEEESINDTINSNSKFNENDDNYHSVDDKNLIINISSGTESDISKTSGSLSIQVQEIVQSELLYGDIDNDNNDEFQDYDDLQKHIYDVGDNMPQNSFDETSNGKNINFLTGEKDLEQVSGVPLKATSTKLLNSDALEFSCTAVTKENLSKDIDPIDLSIVNDISNISETDKTQFEINVITEINSISELNSTTEMNSTAEMDLSMECGNISTTDTIESKNYHTIEENIDTGDDIELKVSDDDDNQNTKIYSVGIDTENTINNNSNKNKIIHKKQEENTILLELNTLNQSKYNLRKNRVSSIDIEDIETKANTGKRNILRASSVPRTIESSGTPIDSPQNKLRKRADSTDCNISTPKRAITRRLSTFLEQIEENSLQDSPARRTRSRLRLDSIDSDKTQIFDSVAGPSSETTPMSTKRGRKFSGSTPNTTGEITKTPRTTRAKSVLSEDNSQTLRTITRRLSTSKASAIKEEPDEVLEIKISDNESEKSSKQKGKSVVKKASSVKMKRSTSKEIVDVIEKKDDEITTQKNNDKAEEYAGSRRLTRTQKNIMEKSIGAKVNPKTVPLKKRQTKAIIDDTDDDIKEHISETESISSQKSKKSVTSAGVTKRTTRSLYSLKEVDDEKVSVTSSTKSSKSTTGKKKTSTKTKESISENLKIIPEENQENKDDSSDSSNDESSIILPPRKRGRPKYNKN